MMREPNSVPLATDLTPKLTAWSREHGRWLLAGLAVLVVVVISFSGTGPTKPAHLQAPVTASTMVKPTSPEQVRSFTQQLQKETAELAVEKQQAEAMKAEAQSLAGHPMQQQAATQSYAVQPLQQPPAPRPAASNVVVSFRQGAKVEASDQSEIRNLIEAQKAALMETMKAAPLSTQANATAAPAAAPPVAAAPAPQQNEELTKADGNRYKLFEGTLIETVLTNRLNGTFTGPVVVIVSSPTYSHDREHVLIPRGSRIIGEARRVGSLGQQRLSVVFHRIVMPDGFSVNLDQFTGLNAIGETGLKDQVNHHYAQLFGTSVAIGLVSGFSGFGTGSALTADGFDQYRQRVGSSLGQSASQVLEQQLTSVLPTITIREGHRVRVFISRDIELPAYENHRLKGDL